MSRINGFSVFWIKKWRIRLQKKEKVMTTVSRGEYIVKEKNYKISLMNYL